MNAYAAIQFLSSDTINGRTVRRAMVELTSETGQWLGSFTTLGFSTQELKDKAYLEADFNMKNKGYVLQALLESK